MPESSMVTLDALISLPVVPLNRATCVSTADAGPTPSPPPAGAVNVPSALKKFVAPPGNPPVNFNTSTDNLAFGTAPLARFDAFSGVEPNPPALTLPAIYA